MAIIGAGPVGLALGLLMAQRCPPWSVSVFDARPLEADVLRDGRTLALSLGSVQLLRQLQAWPHQGTQPILQVQVVQETPGWSGWAERPEVNIRAQDLNVDQLGAVATYGTLVQSLQLAWQAAAAGQPTRLHHRFGHAVRGVKVVQAEPGSSQAAQVEVDAGVCERFDLAVVAEGGVFLRGNQREQLQIETLRRAPELRHDYGQTAWVGTVDVDGGQPGLAIECFSRQGPVALLPLPGAGRASLVWCVKADEDPVADLNDGQRMAVLNSILPATAGRIVKIGPLKSFALGLQAQTGLVQGDCLVRIGNAAQTLHPVAGQGLNLGLRDAHALVDRLRQAQRRQESIAQALARVNLSRAPDRWSMIAATDFLARSFTWALPGAATARALGLMAVEHLPGVKSALARQMMWGRR